MKPTLMVFLLTVPCFGAQITSTESVASSVYSNTTGANPTCMMTATSGPITCSSSLSDNFTSAEANANVTITLQNAYLSVGAGGQGEAQASATASTSYTDSFTYAGTSPTALTLSVNFSYSVPYSGAAGVTIDLDLNGYTSGGNFSGTSSGYSSPLSVSAMVNPGDTVMVSITMNGTASDIRASGGGINASYNVVSLPTGNVPEPSTFALVPVALVAAGLLRRRTRR